MNHPKAIPVPLPAAAALLLAASVTWNDAGATGTGTETDAGPHRTAGAAAENAATGNAGSSRDDGRTAAPTPERPRPGAPAEASWIPRTGGQLADLIESCGRPGPRAASPARRRSCSGFQAGLIIGMSYMAKLSGAGRPFCIREGVSDERIDGAILNLVNNNPRAEDMPSPAVVLAALVENFPCKKQGE